MTNTLEEEGTIIRHKRHLLRFVQKLVHKIEPNIYICILALSSVTSCIAMRYGVHQ